ncbi:uncharacterized protein LOC122062102 [Macadamia integrifolia]|uniref:uncharacterized protein LOC122062102 n=1 Tax=Macadamia integrifolia TaxID=60698 RepID=UPI001C527FD0|nr:uncharacterized protein LOC122062102 [Macadamia integrifolia]
MDEEVPQPCYGCADALCYFCNRYPGGLKGKPKSLMFFHDNKWEGFPPCIHPILMNSFLMMESIVHVDGHDSHIIDFKKMTMVDTKTGDRKPLAWLEQWPTVSYCTLDLTLRLGSQPHMNEENKMEGNQVNLEDDAAKTAENDGSHDQDKMEEDPDEFTMDEEVLRPCYGCADPLCYFCNRYPGGLKGKPKSLKFFHDNKWEGFPPCIHPTLMNSFLMMESIIQVDGHDSHIIDFKKMTMVDTKTGDQKPLAWIEQWPTVSYCTLDLTLRLGTQPHMNEENKMEGSQVNLEDDAAKPAENDGSHDQEKMEENPVHHG